MNILFLSHRIPYPPDKGDKIRSFNEIKFLSKSHNIYLGTILDEESEKVYVNELKKYCKKLYAVYFNRKIKLLKSLLSPKPFSISNFYDKSLQDFVNMVLKDENIDAVICFCSSMAEYIFKNPLYRKKALADTKLLMDFVDLDSDKWLQYANYTRFPLNLIYGLEHRRLFKYELKINQSFKYSVFVSQREEKVFDKLYPEAKNVKVILNGVDYEYFLPKPMGIKYPVSSIKYPALVFTGVMDYFANEDGVKWFCESIFPTIRAEFPHAQFIIVGNRPTNVVWNLSEIDGVTVTGYVDNIQEYYWMADVCVMPLRIARGLQNKVLESMVTGNAVVATSNAADGIICKKGIDILIADDEETFAKEVIKLLMDESRRKDIGRKAVENIRKNYSWEANLKAFNDLLYADE